MACVGHLRPSTPICFDTRSSSTSTSCGTSSSRSRSAGTCSSMTLIGNTGPRGTSGLDHLIELAMRGRQDRTSTALRASHRTCRCTLQVKLLRVIQEKSGGRSVRRANSVDVRSCRPRIASSMRCQGREVPRGPVLPINVIELHVPALRSGWTTCRSWSTCCWTGCRSRSGASPEMTDAAMDKLLSYAYPEM